MPENKSKFIDLGGGFFQIPLSDGWYVCPFSGQYERGPCVHREEGEQREPKAGGRDAA